LAVIIESKAPKMKESLLYEMKFLVPNYSCLQNPWLGYYRPPDRRSLCPQLNLLNPPPEKKLLGTPLNYSSMGFRPCCIALSTIQSLDCVYRPAFKIRKPKYSLSKNDLCYEIPCSVLSIFKHWTTNKVNCAKWIVVALSHAIHCRSFLTVTHDGAILNKLINLQYLCNFVLIFTIGLLSFVRAVLDGFIIGLFFFFFHWHYSPLWALACRAISFHFFLSLTNSLHHH
jgi:hypothetical protein